MSNTDNASAPVVEDEDYPRALTFQTRDGRRYIRRQETRTQIRDAMRTSPADWEITRLRSETIVHLVRAYRNDARMMPEYGPLVRELGRRVARIVCDNSHGLGRQARDDLIDSIQDRILSLIFESSPSRRGEFIEVSFRRVVRGLALNAGEAHFTRQEEHPVVRIASNDSPQEEDAGVVLADPALPADEVKILLESLDAITDPRHREAFVLRYAYHWPIFRRDNSVTTLCGHFNIKRRQLNTWLRTALSQVRNKQGERE